MQGFIPDKHLLVLEVGPETPERSGMVFVGNKVYVIDDARSYRSMIDEANERLQPLGIARLSTTST